MLVGQPGLRLAKPGPHWTGFVQYLQALGLEASLFFSFFLGVSNCLIFFLDGLKLVLGYAQSIGQPGILAEVLIGWIGKIQSLTMTSPFCSSDMELRSDTS